MMGRMNERQRARHEEPGRLVPRIAADPSLRKSSSIVLGQSRDDETHCFRSFRPSKTGSWRDERVESHWPLSYREKESSSRPVPLAQEDAHAWTFVGERHDSSRESDCGTFLFFAFLRVSRSVFSSLSVPLKLPSSRSRDKTAQAGFRDKKEEATACICVYSRLFYRGALRYTWDLYVFPSFSFEDE